MRIEDVRQLGPDAQRQIAAYLLAKGAADARKNKYGNIKTEAHGITFDSKKEAARFEELLQLERAGEIYDLKLQPEFTLQEAFTTTEGKKVRAIRYRADFSYKRKEWHDVEHNSSRTGYGEVLVIEDVKSEATRQNKTYVMKKKLMAERGYAITEV